MLDMSSNITKIYIILNIMNKSTEYYDLFLLTYRTKQHNMMVCT